MNDFLNTVLAEPDTTDLQETLQRCEVSFMLLVPGNSAA
jgi:hypothetical protein